MSFLSVMKKIGEDIKIAFEDVVKYLPAAASLASLIFPAQAGAIQVGVTSIDLIQKAVATVEQKFTAAGAPSGTGPQKLANVLSIVTPTVTQLLTAEGVKNVDTALVTNITNAVVAILNVSSASTAA